jgi:capsular exopolysaccharide synthesis family protein
MATVLGSNLSNPSRAGMNGREVKRIKLPTYRDNPLLVNGAGSVSSESVEAYKSLRTQVLKAQVSQGVCTVAVTSAAHGDGKTLTSFNLAYTCAQLRTVPVLLVDADLRTSGLTKLLGSSIFTGLADVLDERKSFSETVVATDLDNLHVIGAGQSSESAAELFSGERWIEFMTWARENFNLVIIDSLPVRAVADFELISAASDGILMVVRALQTPREGLEEALAHIDANKLVGVVWNGAERQPKYSSYNYGAR